MQKSLEYSCFCWKQCFDHLQNIWFHSFFHWCLTPFLLCCMSLLYPFWGCNSLNMFEIHLFLTPVFCYLLSVRPSHSAIWTFFTSLSRGLKHHSLCPSSQITWPNLLRHLEIHLAIGKHQPPPPCLYVQWKKLCAERTPVSFDLCLPT